MFSNNKLMEYVPSEIIAVVLSYMSVKQIVAVCRVCKAWSNCVDEYRIFEERIVSKIPHLRVLDNEKYTAQLGVAVEEKYLIVSGDCEDNLQILQKQFTQKGLNVDIYDTRGGAIVDSGYIDATLFTYEYLREYSAVLVFNYSMSFHNQTKELGDMLAKYIENGGGVVQGLYAMCSNCNSGILEGEFENYCPIYYESQDELQRETELVRKIPDHFILSGVAKFKQEPYSGYSLTSQGLRTTELTNVVATFNDENNTLAIVCKEIQGRNKGRVCVLNFYPAYLKFDETNAAELLTNTLLFCGMKTNNE